MIIYSESQTQLYLNIFEIIFLGSLASQITLFFHIKNRVTLSMSINQWESEDFCIVTLGLKFQALFYEFILQYLQ